MKEEELSRPKVRGDSREEGLGYYYFHAVTLRFKNITPYERNE